MEAKFKDLTAQINEVGADFIKQLNNLGKVVSDYKTSECTVYINGKPALLIKSADGNAMIVFNNPTEKDFEALKNKLA